MQQALEAEKFNKELFKMKANMDDVGRAMANPMVSGLNALIERFALAKKEGDGFLVTLLKQTEIARLLGMDKPSNGYTETRKELDLLNKSLLSGDLSQAEQKLIPNSEFRQIDSLDGHLALFGTDADAIGQIDVHLKALLAEPAPHLG